MENCFTGGPAMGWKVAIYLLSPPVQIDSEMQSGTLNGRNSEQTITMVNIGNPVQRFQVLFYIWTICVLFSNQNLHEINRVHFFIFRSSSWECTYNFSVKVVQVAHFDYFILCALLFIESGIAPQTFFIVTRETFKSKFCKYADSIENGLDS